MNIIENIKNTIGEAVISALNLAIEKGDVPAPEENIDFSSLLKHWE